MVQAALDGSLANVPSAPDSVFGLMVPKSCPDVPSEVLDSRCTWKDKGGYDFASAKLAAMFHESFRQFEADVKDEIRDSAPHTPAHLMECGQQSPTFTEQPKVFPAVLCRSVGRFQSADSRISRLCRASIARRQDSHELELLKAFKNSARN